MSLLLLKVIANKNALQMSAQNITFYITLTLTGFNITRLPTISAAIERVLAQLYFGIPLPLQLVSEKHLSKSDRNAQVCERYAGGETLEEIAKDYKLSHQRVHEIILRWCN